MKNYISFIKINLYYIYLVKMNKRKSKKAGKAIDAGGFGCVFRPQIRCKQSKKKKRSKVDGISKLMSKDESANEWRELKNIKKIVSKIPNYKNYFLLNNIEICSPDILDKEDLVNIEKCRSGFQSMNIDIDEINKNLDKFKIINMPYGGKNLVNVISSGDIDFNILNILLIELLSNAILPMNKLAFYHCDIKGQNILYKDNNLRLIDWGISTYLNSLPINNIPESLSNYAIQYNSPFSRIIFNQYFDKFVFEYLSAHPEINLNSSKLNLELELMMLSFYNEYIKLRNSRGHEEFINTYLIPHLIKLNNIEAPKDLNYTAILFSQYLINILKKYTNFKSKKVDKLGYLNDIYLKNLDIWGFIFVYLEFILNSQVKKEIKIKIANLIIKYCYSIDYSDKPIPIDDLSSDLKNLNKIRGNNTNVVNLKKMFSLD